MLVYVLNKHGVPLMPCKPRKARVLLRDGKARVVKRTPFTIQLLFGSSGYRQNITLGVDSGFSNIGLSAVTAKTEVFASEVRLRTDIVELNSERAMHRRTRRGRKTRYRPARFDNRTNKKAGWLAPSIRHKLDTHLKVIHGVAKILPITDVVVEVAQFDIQKIKNPAVNGVGYQQGDQLGYGNVREYVLHRDGHKCRHCAGKSKDRVLHVHHLVSRMVGGDRPDNLVTLCSMCHGLVHTEGKKKIVIKAKPTSKGFKAETFMSMVRWKIIDAINALSMGLGMGWRTRHTYGYITKNARTTNGIAKSHINDAFVIAGGNSECVRTNTQYIQKQVRKCNRKLYKGIRSHIRNTAARFINGFQRYDKVLWKGVECFVFGRRTTGYFDLRTLDGTVLTASGSYKHCVLLESFKTLVIERSAVSASS